MGEEMSTASRDLVFLILQFLEEEKFKDSLHKLEQESGLFFNMRYFERKALAGEWDELEKYLSGFTKVDDNRNSMKMYFEIRKQKYLEALDRNDKGKAVDILVKGLRVFSAFNEELFKEITQLLTLKNFRENELLSKYGDTKSARSRMLEELKKLIETNPLFQDKLLFPTLKYSCLRTLINQSLSWQHHLCQNPRPNPDIKTLLTDHSCSSDGAQAPTPVTLSLVPFRPVPPSANANTSSSTQSAVVAASPLPLHPNQVSAFQHPGRSLNALGLMDYQSPDHEQQMKQLKVAQSNNWIAYCAPSRQSNWTLEDPPRTVACTLNLESNVKSMDFHPSQHTLLTVGCANGEITLWEVALRERLLLKPFRIWDMAVCSALFQATIIKDSSISVSRVSWSPDGKLIGIAFSKHLIHLYGYEGSNLDLHQHMEIDAHIGGVNDLTFSYPNEQPCVVTCGDDKLIKVWNLAGRKLFNFEGHEAPVYSLCSHQKENIQFLFSTSVDGKIKAWLYDNMGSRFDYDAPGLWCTKLLYSADGHRLFSCGTSKDGYSYLVEWNESEGTIKRTYAGFHKKSAGIVQFDTTKNRFLAAGEDHRIKFWDMDNVNVLTTIDAEGGLPSLPLLRYNKEGNLLVVNTANNGLKLLANAEGLRMLRAIETQSCEASKTPTKTKNGVDPVGTSLEIQRCLNMSDKLKPWKPTEIVEPVQCRIVTMPNSTDSMDKVARLLYTNSGADILALSSMGIQKLWKWSCGEQNPSGKATASVVPRHWQPFSCPLMTNDVPENAEEAVPCIALSRNDSYVISACGGKISLFNILTFKVMTTFMSPPPAPTSLVFHPLDNNIIAIGMEDSTIHIYNVRLDKVKTKLKGHQKRITGLAFSTSLNILVSSGADAQSMLIPPTLQAFVVNVLVDGDGQLSFWNTDSWGKRKSIQIQMPAGKAPVGDTRVQFHCDQVHLILCHETQLAVYEASKMEMAIQWVPQNVLSAPISSSAYSCNGEFVYAAFIDGNIGVFDADNLQLRCRIASSAYLSQALSNSQMVYPLVVTAHPQEPNQLAVGLTDGSVKVIEPAESEGKWGIAVPVDNETHNGRTALSSATNLSIDLYVR